MGKLIICRHGQTPYNLHKLMTGLADPDLTELGEEQAKEEKHSDRECCQVRQGKRLFEQRKDRFPKRCHGQAMETGHGQ